MWLDLAIAFSCAGGGVVCGWIMHALVGFGNHTLVKQAAASIMQPEWTEEPSQERISEVAERLRAFSLSMAADVDAHQSKVQTVNNTLTEGNDASPEAVVEAVGQLIEANETMQTRLQEAQDRIHEQTVQIESAERRAHTDALTHVPNRGAFDLHLHQQHALGAGEAGTLALLDVDHFKKFNDVYGHRAGDEVLRIVAKMLHARLHAYGIVARFGGEEFAIILNECPVDRAKDLIESARIAIGERDIQFEDKRLRVAASAGVAELIQGESGEDWLQRADDAMYRSKAAGRNCGHWMDVHVPVRIELADDLRDRAPSPPPDRTIEGQAPLRGPLIGEPSISDPGASAATDNDLPSVDFPSVDFPAHASKQLTSGAFASLPDFDMLGTAFREIRDRTHSNVSLYVMAIICVPEKGKTPMRSLLQIVRATLRSVDRLGRDNDSTLLVCMPSIDEATAMQRSQQILRSAEAIGLGIADCGVHQVRVGVTQARDSEEFTQVVSRAIRATDPYRLNGVVVDSAVAQAAVVDLQP